MVHIDIHTIGGFSKGVQKKLAQIGMMNEPAFARYVPGFEKMFACAAKYSAMDNFIFVGQGGAVSSFDALFHALGLFKTTKQVFIVHTTDSDYIAYVKKKCSVEKTLVVGISSSGTNINQIEAFLAFQGYQRFVIARRLPSALVNLAEREGIEMIESPDLSDRFAGHSELALLPAAFVYMPADKIFAGMRQMFMQCRPGIDFENNPALKIALVLFLLEQEGYTEVFAPIYSMQLYGFAEFIMQIMHETVCKDGKGQTFLTLVGPEMQHHSSQRFFGGKKDMIGLFMRVAETETKESVHVPAKAKDVFIRDDYLKIIDGITLEKSMWYEYKGTKEEADALKIPNMTITLEKITPEEIGKFLALWEYIGFYSAFLRDVDPFTQPAVEGSKDRSFAMRKDGQ